jgi:hypothetical protein
VDRVGDLRERDVLCRRSAGGSLGGTTRQSLDEQAREWTGPGPISVEGGYIVIHRAAEL